MSDLPPRGAAESAPRADPGDNAVSPAGRERTGLRTLRSSDLLGADGLLGIEHNGELYTLRRTRNGRLILTK